MAARPVLARFMHASRTRALSSPRAPLRSNLPRCNVMSRPSQQLGQLSRNFSAHSALGAKRYSQDHEWVELDSDGTTATVGVSEYAAKALGDVVFVELPTVDQEFAAGDVIGAVESVKSASDILSPVAGKVIEGNQALEEKPGTINKSAEADGWIVKIKVSNTADLDTLMDADAYKAYTEE